MSMPKTIIHTFNEVNLMTVTVRGKGTCRRGDPIIYHKREVLNKMACFFPDTDWNFVSNLYACTCTTSISPGSKLYVASECSTGRDTFRNSGYSITRDINNADVIVVPDVKAEYYASLPCDVVAMDEEKNELYLVTVYKEGYGRKAENKKDLILVRDYLKTAMGLVPDESTQFNLTVWFIPKCDELQEVMMNKTRPAPYVQESLVPVKPSTTFSVETLLFWENIKDQNLLTRTICTSDWMDYPVTLLVFLGLYKHLTGSSNWYNYASNDFRRILKSIGYENYYELRYMLSGKSIYPKDYEMLQAYLYAKMGLEKEGGVVVPVVFNQFPDCLKELLQRRIVLKPMTIPEKLSLEQIEKMI